MDMPPIRQVIAVAYDPASLGMFLTQLGAIAAPAAIAVASIAVLAAGIGAVVGVCVTAVKQTMAWGESLHDIMLKLGATSAEAAGLKLAADYVGISVDTLTQKILLLEKGLVTSTGTAGNSGKELDRLGINYRNANGTLMTSTQLLQSVANWFANTTDVVARNNAEMIIFGRSGSDVDELLTHLAGHGMQDFIDKAKALGLALTPSQIAGIENLSHSTNLLKDSFTGIMMVLGVTFIPFLQKAVDWLTKLIGDKLPMFKQGLIDILGILGIPTPAGESPYMVGTATGAVPAAGYTRLGTTGDLATGNKPVYFDPTTGGITTNPPMLGGSPSVVRPGGRNPGASAYALEEPAPSPMPTWWDDFLTTLKAWATSIETAWPIFEDDLKKFSDAMSKIPWGTIADDFLKFAAVIGPVVVTAAQVINILLTPGGGAALLSAIWGEGKGSGRGYNPHAAGGQLSNNWAMVGEEGYELISPTGYVYPHEDSQLMMLKGLFGVQAFYGGGSFAHPLEGDDWYDPREANRLHDLVGSVDSSGLGPAAGGGGNISQWIADLQAGYGGALGGGTSTQQAQAIAMSSQQAAIAVASVVSQATASIAASSNRMSASSDRGASAQIASQITMSGMAEDIRALRNELPVTQLKVVSELQKILT